MTTYQPPPIWKFRGSSPKIIENDTLADYFRREIDNGSPNILCTGVPNIGKSESMIELITRIYPQFDLSQDIVFTLDEFWDKIDLGKGNRYRCKLLDDFGSELDATRGMTTEARDIIHYLQTVRTDHTAIVITTPIKGFLNKDIRERIADYFIELRRKNTTAKFNQGVVHYNQRNNVVGKAYHHSLCLDVNGLINNKDRGTKIWGWVFYPPSNEIHEAYYPLREAKHELNRMKGQARNQTRKAREQTEEQTAQQIIDEKDKYIIKTSKGSKKLNKQLIAYDKKLDERSLNRICAKVKHDLNL